MSRTYSIGCTQCNKHIWVGQGNPDDGHIYGYQEIWKFFHEHKDHTLVFKDDEGNFLDSEEIELPDSDAHKTILNDLSNDIGTSKDVLISGDINPAVRREKSIEILMDTMKKITNGEDIVPVVIGSIDGKIVVEECNVDQSGNISLPQLKTLSEEELKEKSKFVRRILTKISPVLQAEIENVTYVALMRKDKDKLDKVMKALKKPNTKVKVENKAGCIWLTIDDYSFVI